MADFVAVIRRAVDGLSDNNAEMRQKVYEKARGAVRRQLESMNPRPSDDLVKRQLDKLEAAIGDVENEHAEALPVEEPVPEPVDDLAPEPVADEAAQPEPVVQETAAAEPEAELTEAEPEAKPVEVEPEQHVEPHEQPVAEPVESREDAPAEAAFETEPVAETSAEETPAVEPESREAVVDEAVADEPQAVAAEAHVEPSWHVEAAPANDYVPSWHEPETTTETTKEELQSVTAVEPEAQVYTVHDEQVPDAEPVADARMPSAEAQWNWNEAPPVIETTDNRTQPVDTVTDPRAWDWPDEKAGQPADTSEKAAPVRDWGDLDELLGQTAPKTGAAAAGTAAMAEAGLADAATSPTPAVETARAPQRSFRAEPRKSRINFAAFAALVALIAIIGGAGAGYWFNRDTVNGWVNERIASFTTPSTETPAETTQTNQTAEGGRNLPAETAQTPTDDAASTTPTTTEVASTSQNSSGKFTQRLLTDGSEVDQGPAPALDGATPEEGKSVAAQSTETAEAAQGGAAGTGGAVTTGGAATTPGTGTDGTAQTPAGTDTATTTDTQTPATTGEQPAAIGVTQKMFLYEERLGQTAPTAIEGTVAWSSAEESPGGDAKAEPVVRAQVNVPSKGLTALITFRRNGDRSLPASHLVELVFSLPENFEGGGIESVQRVAMKRTEQDRGDALIAVPAKITDDFHMIALNDFPEAIAKNTELLRTRNWIDIPITYRNGRRALLTLDKGTAGAEAFDKVMKAWTTAAANP